VGASGSGWALQIVEVVNQGSGAAALFAAGGRLPELLAAQAAAAAPPGSKVAKPDPETTPLVLNTPDPSYYKARPAAAQSQVLTKARAPAF
jgi:hypothetical protein